MFTPGSWYSQATTSSYTSPKDIDLHHLFYDGIGFYGLLYGHTYLTDRERAYLTSLDPESVMQYFRAPRQVMDAVLKEYFGVSLAETNQVELSKFIYWAETDTYPTRLSHPVRKRTADPSPICWETGTMSW